MKTETVGVKKELRRLLIADAVMILVCIGVGAILGLCLYGGQDGVLYLIRTVCFLAGGILLLATAVMILHRKDIRSTAEKRESRPLFETIPLFVVLLQAGALAIIAGLVADGIVRSLMV